MLNIVSSLIPGKNKGVEVKGAVVLMQKNVLDFNDFTSTVIDAASELLLGQGVSLQLVSATVGDPNNGNRGLIGEPANLQPIISVLPSIAAGESNFSVTFKWDEDYGIPGAFIIKNNRTSQFFLKSVTINNFLDKGRIHFDCNSWVYPTDKYKYDRIFFTNDTYLPEKIPAPLKPYRDEELLHLRGDDVTRKFEEWDRIYNYAYYNDLGNPDLSSKFARPVLGGSEELPYPRRGKTGREPTKTDPNSESRIPLIMSLDIYIPRDERFGHLKMSDFLAYGIKALVKSVFPVLNSIFDETPNEFDSFQDVLNLYEGGLKLPQIDLLNQLKEQIPFELIKEIITIDGDAVLKFPVPQVIREDKWTWRTDEEFCREMLAGVNPIIIQLIKEFPPTSNLDPDIYGDQTSKITASHIENNLNGLSVDEALNNKRLFILDHHDTIRPYLNKINSIEGTKIYATRTLLFLQDDGTLTPLAIELSLPESPSKVYTPAQNGIEGAIWQLAKAYATVNDSGVHQLISHWLNTHAVMEPFVIATNRQLSVVHPIYKLLYPHYRDTMNINALARQTLINAGGILESTVFPGKYAMEMSAVVYKSWNFMEQALPADLIKRGVAVEDPSNPNNVQLLIKDYPYAVDGLAIWSAIHTWVTEYCTIYYPDDATLQADAQVQAWWKEIREVGHGDKQHETWWPSMKLVSELIHTCTTVIWIASALHASVNFGQYPYAGYLPNRPTISRRFMPEPGSPEYEMLATDPDKVFLKTVTSELQTLLGISLIEILSKHASDEVYLGKRDSEEWTSDEKALEAFRRFGTRLEEIEKEIVARNEDPNLKNRNGPVKMPYSLLYPTSDPGLTAKGVPNSVSI
ncbi:linoleate 9S-lipoxygenase protein [Dioscorea alata]|uniref:Linoleate 9S-lipoxygenase protein n=2 Tax=Dioscorea alata TaxID=55571 RepID=A0ACB7UXV1_DIOAL|nr:linoleate 9S-lipoxygenase protein [Dioscorea alata]